ncbi:MAG: hypothetical protein KDD10_16845, partial [Phaeodactylibacter sp.]|nr:hypothetical protein [Phaeodactylibacter sp.]
MKKHLFSLIILSGIFLPLSAQTCYQDFFQKGKEAFGSLQFQDALNNFEAAKICPEITSVQREEIDNWISKTTTGYIDAITQEKERAEAAQKRAEEQARISEANRRAFLANQAVEQGQKEDALYLAFTACQLVETNPIPSVEKAFGDAVFLNYASALEGHAGPLAGASFSQDGNRLVTWSRDKTAALWSKEGRLIAHLKGHNGYLYA